MHVVDSWHNAQVFRMLEDQDKFCGPPLPQISRAFRVCSVLLAIALF